jgi:hypothetical protein
VLELVVASGICGLLLGWHCKVYVTLPMVLVLLGPAYFLGQADGLMRGILAFVFSLIAMQVCFLISGIIQVYFLDNFAPTGKNRLSTGSPARRIEAAGSARKNTVIPCESIGAAATNRRWGISEL